MKTLTRVALCALAVGLVPFSTSYAQDPVDLAPDTAADEMDAAIEAAETEDPSLDVEEQMDMDDLEEEVTEGNDPYKVPTIEEAQAALNALPGAKDAVKGEVKGKPDDKVYDIYGRQLSYREGAKKYRESLDKRRENFAKPRTKMIEEYKKTRDMIYAAETAEYQKKLNEEQENEKANTGARKLPTGEALSAVQEDSFAEEIGLKEQRIPGEDSEMQKVRKKVVTAGDAPEFDPARLNNNMGGVPAAVPVPVEGAEPPPMPMPEVIQPKEEIPAVEEKAAPAEEMPQPLMEEEEPENEVIEVEAPKEAEAMMEEEPIQTEPPTADEPMAATPEEDIPAIAAPVEEAGSMVEEIPEVMMEEEAPSEEAVQVEEPEMAVPELTGDEEDELLEDEAFDNPFDDEALDDPFGDEDEAQYNN